MRWMPKLTKRSFLAVALVAAVTIWLSSSALVAWTFTRRSYEPFSEPPPPVTWAEVEAHRLKTSPDSRLARVYAWKVMP